MIEEVNMSEVVDEIKNANEDELREVITNWYEQTRTDGMRVGAKFISAAIFGVIQKHTKKVGKVSLNDYRRMTAEIIKIISVQVADQNNSEDVEVTEESSND